MVRVYLVTKKNGKQDVLNRANVIPNTVELVHVAYGNGKGDKVAKIARQDFLNNFEWVSGCEWKARA